MIGNGDLATGAQPIRVATFDKKLTKLPIKFRHVSGMFSVSYNDLTTLEGCPEFVGISFSCSHNKLTSLKYSPKIVEGPYICNDNSKQFTQKEVLAVTRVEEDDVYV